MKTLVLYVGGAVVLAFGVAVAIALAGDRLRDLKSKALWGSVSLGLAAVSYLAPPLISPRQVSELGAASEPSGLTNLVSTALQYPAAGAALVAILLPSTRSARLPDFFLVGVVGMLLAKSVGGVLGGVGVDQYFIFWGIIVLGVAAAVADDQQITVARIRMVARYVTVGSILSAAIAPSWAVMTVSESGREFLGLGRLLGVTPHPNGLADFAVVALALELFGPKGKFRPTCALAAVGCLIFAQSSSGLVAGSLVLLVWVAQKIGSWRPAVIPVATAGVLALTASSDNLIDAVFSSGRFDTVSGRSIIWHYSWNSIVEHPTFGLGNQFLSETFRQENLPANQQQAVHAHNQLIQVLGDSGFVGGFFFVILMGGLLVHAVRTARIDGGGRLATWVAFALLMYTEVPLRAAGPTAALGIITLAWLVSNPAVETGMHAVGQATRHPKARSASGRT